MSDLITSATKGNNADVFPDVLELHVEDGSKVCDATYGEGTFWNDVDASRFDIHRSDLDPSKSPDIDGGSDCRDLPYDDGAFDAFVLDPPYAEGFYRRNSDKLGTSGEYQSYGSAYNGKTPDVGGSKYHQAVLTVYFEAGHEAKRVLNEEGTLIVKVQDEVSANKQELTHIQVTNYYESCLGFYTKDCFVLQQNSISQVPGVDSQVHARKNHSFFMVYEANGGPRNAVSPYLCGCANTDKE